MSIKLFVTWVLFACCLIMSVSGCEPERTTTPVLPGQIAVFKITFSPNPVYQGYSDTYRFTVFIEEVNGVGARVSSLKVEDVDQDGAVLHTDQYNEQDVVRTFGTSRIEAFGKLMTNVALTQCYGCSRENWLVRADDDQGNDVEYAQSVELITR